MSDEKKTWVGRFPKPEGERPPHPGEEPSEPLKPDWQQRSKEWFAKKRAYNDHGIAMRKWLVARGLDEMQSRTTTPVEDVVYVLGIEYLEGGSSPNIFGSLFGGLL